MRRRAGLFPSFSSPILKVNYVTTGVREINVSFLRKEWLPPRGEMGVSVD
jgi:hypothetical protein